jgi:hypothetical protein
MVHNAGTFDRRGSQRHKRSLRRTSFDPKRSADESQKRNSRLDRHRLMIPNAQNTGGVRFKEIRLCALEAKPLEDRQNGWRSHTSNAGGILALLPEFFDSRRYIGSP